MYRTCDLNAKSHVCKLLLVLWMIRPHQTSSVCFFRDQSVKIAVKDMDLRKQLFEEVPEGYVRWKAAREKFVGDLDAMVAAGRLPDALRQARRALHFLEPNGTDRALWERADAVLQRLVISDDASAQPLQVCSSTTGECDLPCSCKLAEDEGEGDGACAVSAITCPTELKILIATNCTCLHISLDETSQ